MAPRFHKYKLLLDENMSDRSKFPRLNGLFDVKHIRDDLNISGIPDSKVHAIAVKQKRIIITFNVKDFTKLATKHPDSGVIGVSANLPNHQIDLKLTALLVKTKPKNLYGKFNILES